MTAEFVRERITQLRMQKGVSEYKMSYDLGHSRGYINNISSGKSLPPQTADSGSPFLSANRRKMCTANGLKPVRTVIYCGSKKRTKPVTAHFIRQKDTIITAGPRASIPCAGSVIRWAAALCADCPVRRQMIWQTILNSI